jgi:hypothetical protein
VRLGCSLSAANTPNCAVKELETRMRVLTSAKGTFRICASFAQRSGAPAFRLKYIAKRPAKNITSLPSQTIVPTDVEFGLLITGGAIASEVEVMFQGYPRKPFCGPETARFPIFLKNFCTLG